MDAFLSTTRVEEKRHDYAKLNDVKASC